MSTRRTPKKKLTHGWRSLLLACAGIVVAVGAVAKIVTKDSGAGSQSTISVNIFQVNVTNTVKDSATPAVSQP